MLCVIVSLVHVSPFEVGKDFPLVNRNVSQTSVMCTSPSYDVIDNKH